jgi:glucosamine-6-phosphate deaminase
MSLITPKIYADPETLGRFFATRLLNEIAQAKTADRSFLLGCPGGRSPKPVYEAMGAALATAPQDMSHVVIVMMDDYLVETPTGLDHVPIESHFSCRRFARDDIAGVINASLPASFRIPSAQIWFPDPRDPAAYDGRIAAAGGIDLFILASGASDGHVAFNPARQRAGQPVAHRAARRGDAARQYENLSGFPLARRGAAFRHHCRHRHDRAPFEAGGDDRLGGGQAAGFRPAEQG